MSDTRASDLHLKRELTQIRKAARALRDPGTTSSWRSPLASSSSRSAAAIVASLSSRRKYGSSGDDAARKCSPGHLRSRKSGKRVFLYNWSSHPKSEEDYDDYDDDDDGGGGGYDDGDGDGDGEGIGVDETTSLTGGSSIGDSVSDARNNGGGGERRSAGARSLLALRRRDVDLAPPLPLPPPSSSSKRRGNNKRLMLMNNCHVDVLSKYRKDLVLSRKLNSLGLGIDRDENAGHSDDTNSEDTRRMRNRAYLRGGRRGDSSYSYSTPALSTSSFNRCCYGTNCNPSTAGSWDGTTMSPNHMDDDEADDNLDFPGRQGCGIPCYWSKRATKHRGACRGCCSPSFSDTLRRKGNSILCGGQIIYPRRRRTVVSSSKRRVASRSADGVLPLLTGGGESSVGTGRSDGELSTNFDELEMEGLSRLDGQRWSSSCRSLERFDMVALNGVGDEEEEASENVRSFGHKYKPIFFHELIGQSIVVQSLSNAVSRGRIAPVYLFQGPRGTGKTSAARIFASALNCLASDESKPCGHCRECVDINSGKSKDLWEFDATDKRGIDKVCHLMRNMLSSGSSNTLRYRVLVIDDCNLLSSKAWLFFLKFLEEPPQRVVLVLVTTDLDNVPRAVQSRCQRYSFNKIKETDIVARLRKISAEENLDVEQDALDFIALNADGSLRDAETMLEQLSLLGKRISKSLVNELVGIVSDEKLFELLEAALSSDTAETVKRARELMDSGADPIVLMCQLASLIMDIIAGTYNIVDDKGDAFFSGRNMNEAELERLKHALKILSEAEKQLRISSERSTWFTATLLQLGSMSSPDPNRSSSSWRQSHKMTVDYPSTASTEAAPYKQKSDDHSNLLPYKSCSPGKKSINGVLSGDVSAASCDDNLVGNIGFQCVNSEKLDCIWAKSIEKCHSKTLRQLLHTHGKLFSLSDVDGALIAYVAFSDENIKIRAERFLSSITNSMEMVLRCNIEVRIILLPSRDVTLNVASSPLMNVERKPLCLASVSGLSKSQPLPNGNRHCSTGSSKLSAEAINVQESDEGERRHEIPMQRIESIIREQRLESAWLEAAEKGTPGSRSRLKPEKNQVLPQEVGENQTDAMPSNGLSLPKWEDELNRELKVLKPDNGKVVQKDQTGRKMEHYPMSPSLLHGNSFMAGTRDNRFSGSESGSTKGGCSGFLCWNSSKSRSMRKVRRNPVRPRKGRRFSLFGECGKAKNRESRLRT